MKARVSKTVSKTNEITTDCVLRAMTQDGQFRVMAAQTTETAAEAAQRQNAEGELMERQAQLLCAGVLLRETIQPGNRVQVIFKDSKGNRLVTDSLPEGCSRSIVDQGLPEGKDGIFQVSIALRNGELHQGIVSVADDLHVGRAVMQYLQSSEQITAFVHIASQWVGDQLRVGGFVVQVTPEVQREGLEAMTSYLESLETNKMFEAWMREGRDVSVLVKTLLEGHEYTELSNSTLCFGCTCSEERMLLGLSTLPKQEIGEILAEGKPLALSCNGCGENYQISTDAIATLLCEESDPKTPPN